MKTFEQDEGVQICIILLKYNFFQFSTDLQKQQKIITCFLEDKLSTIYLDIQIENVFTSALNASFPSGVYVCMCIYIYTHTQTLTGHFIRYTLLVPGWTPFCLQNCLNSSCHRFNKVLKHSSETFFPVLMLGLNFSKSSSPHLDA